MTAQRSRILVIRTGALGDLIFCLQAFQDIRKAYPTAEIALLTRAPFTDFARSMPYFDQIIVDRHPRNWRGWRDQLKEIKKFAPTLVYDLQGKTRQTLLYLFGGGPMGPAWSGAAPLCKYPRLWPPTPGMHFTDFLAAQLRLANVPPSGPLDLLWLGAPVKKFNLPFRYVVFVPGSSPGALYKRWSSHNYAAIGQKLLELDLVSIIVGTDTDAPVAEAIEREVPSCINLCGRTPLLELAEIVRRSSCVIGSDTGPIHMAAAVGAPTLALFSGKSSTFWSRPPGRNTETVQKERLVDLSVDEVLSALQTLLHHTESKGR